MTDYLPYTSGEYAVDAPATALHFERWFRNWEAGFEGAAGAPRINPIGAMSHNGEAGAVGTYVLARRIVGTADLAFGQTVAGSNIAPASAATSLQNNGGTTAGTAAFSTDAALSGTWRCMGYLDHSVVGSPGSVNTLIGATLFLRIA